MSTMTFHPNSCGISPVCHIFWTMCTRHIQRSVLGWGVLRVLSRVFLTEPLFEVLCVEVVVSACLNWAQAVDRCIRLCL